MVQRAGLKLLDEEKYICNEKWFNWFTKQDNEVKYATTYEVLKNDYILDMKDLINYCLTYHYNIEIPKNFKVTTIYTITLTTCNFEPDRRYASNTNTHGLFSSADKNFIEQKFKIMCKSRKQGSYKNYDNKRHHCWHGDDYSYNQIIHSYDISETYLVEEV